MAVLQEQGIPGFNQYGQNMLIGSNGSHEIMKEGLKCDMPAYEYFVVGVWGNHAQNFMC